MHPRQASVVAEIEAVRAEIAEKHAKQTSSEDLVAYVDRVVAAAAQVVLWQYRDPEGNRFWLDRKVTTALRSPYGGPQFTPKAERILPSQIGKDESEVPSLSWDDPPELRTLVAKGT